jgi:hypothetical protein
VVSTRLPATRSEEKFMPKISKKSASKQDWGPAVDYLADLDDYTVDFVEIREGHSLVELLKGLPDDRCPCPHGGYLFAGRITVDYADHREVYESGDAFYMSRGHVPAAEAGSDLIQFSPRQQLAEVHAHIQARAQQLQPSG